MIVAGLGVLFILLALPLLFGIIREVGRDIAAGDPAIDLFATVFVMGWLLFFAFGIISGVGSEGEVDEQDGLFTVRPTKDVAGGLVVYILVGYLPFLVLPTIVGAAGLAVGVGDIWPIVGVLAAAITLHISAILLGYAVGLFLKGVIRRSPWLSRLKPVLGLTVILGYFWLAFTGSLWPLVTDAASFLEATPLGWFGDLSLVTTPGGGATVTHAIGIIVLTVAVIPIFLLIIVRAGEYAWFVARGAEESIESSRDYTTHQSSTGERLNRNLARLGVAPSTRGIAVVVLIRGYRAPLQLAFVIVPFIFLIPVLDPVIRTGLVPDWMPWVVMLYGAWAAGVGFPLNILGNQGASLPRLLTSPVGGRPVLHGYLLASVIVFAPLTLILSMGTGVLAERPSSTLLLLAVGSVIAVLAGCILGAGIGSLFPRFSSIELTGNTEAVLPSKTAFVLYSFLAVLLSSSVGIIADRLYRELIAAMLTEIAPHGLNITPSLLFVVGTGTAGVVAVALPGAYMIGVNRLGNYRIS